ncbi:hypothetical protein [Candidatus Vondammii sp. HM_W22]|uniref:hypothetical protein n=1 Tax=Candidatus Vondammii sp. HM_W22 TaxID=2687299 RepID=UPI001F140F07|nr:hypothetical protein [Candidatus Vondammii sp. HM_W22]
MSKAKTANPNQKSFLHQNLLDQLNPKHPLLLLARQIDWSYFDAEFARFILIVESPQNWPFPQK